MTLIIRENRQISYPTHKSHSLYNPPPNTHPESIILHDALKEDFELLQNWDMEKEPQKMLVLWRDRAITENWNDVVEEVDSVLFDARWSSLQRICSLSKNESDFGFDPNRIGLVTTSNGKYLLDIDTNLTRVWDSQTGNRYQKK